MGSELAGQTQSWRELTPGAKAFIGLIVILGTGVLLFGAIHQNPRNIPEFTCYLGIAILTSRLKVNLPGIAGTMSVSFLFILLGLLQLSLSETLVLGVASILVQCLYPDRPSAVQVTFNLCATAVSTALAYVAFNASLSNHIVAGQALALGVAAAVYFFANTGSIATVISFTETKSLKKIMVEC
jgi:hypothetical protein